MKKKKIMVYCTNENEKGATMLYFGKKGHK